MPWAAGSSIRYQVSRAGQSFSAAAPHFQWDVVVAEYAEILRGSYWAEGSSLATVLEEAGKVCAELAALQKELAGQVGGEKTAVPPPDNSLLDSLMSRYLDRVTAALRTSGKMARK